MPEPNRATNQTKGLSRYLHHLPALLGVMLLVGAIYVVQKEFRHLKIADISSSPLVPRS